MQTKRGTTLSNSAPHRTAVQSLLIVAFLVITLDSASKALALRTLGTDSKHLIGSFLQLQLSTNSGAAFGLATSATIFLSLLSFLAIAVLYIFSRSITSRPWGIALGFLLGGICGNLVDRVFRAPYLLRGQVIDWIKLPHWPNFNLADTSIVISAVVIVLLLFNDVKPRSHDDVL
ncbi:MAG: signal peptidase II [Actinomycetota bacterium]